MPYEIIYRSNRPPKGRPWKIVKTTSGRPIVGSSKTKSDAEASVRARNAGSHGWKPKRRR